MHSAVRRAARPSLTLLPQATGVSCTRQAAAARRAQVNRLLATGLRHEAVSPGMSREPSSTLPEALSLSSRQPGVSLVFHTLKQTED